MFHFDLVLNILLTTLLQLFNKHVILLIVYKAVGCLTCQIFIYNIGSYLFN